MEFKDLEKLGLNKNEAKVYFGLLQKGQATAAELVKSIGVHRNIIYDNLEKLIGKGLVTYIVDGTKKKFIAENPEAIVEFLKSEETNIKEKIKTAKDFIPEINKILSIKKERQEAYLFRGIRGIKKILSEILSSKEFWVIGVSNASVEALGEIFWKNFNIKRKSKKIRENLLFNNDFKNVVNITSGKFSAHRILPKELIQVTEILIYDNKVAMTVYSKEPIGIVIEDEEVSKTFKQQFTFLWKISKK